jgi:hypothetical protein
MVAKQKVSSQLLQKVAEIYNWIDSLILEAADIAGQCKMCGACCNFESFEHHLFVTTPELMYLATKVGADNIKSMPGTVCPYQMQNKCVIYEYRFAGCRIFCCNADKNFQSRLSESAVRRFKSICVEFNVPYQYTDLPTALNTLLKTQCHP